MQAIIYFCSFNSSEHKKFSYLEQRKNKWLNRKINEKPFTGQIFANRWFIKFLLVKFSRMKNLNVSRDKFLSVDPKLGKVAKISLTKIYPNKVQHCPLRKKFENLFICIALLL